MNLKELRLFIVEEVNKVKRMNEVRGGQIGTPEAVTAMGEWLKNVAIPEVNKYMAQARGARARRLDPTPIKDMLISGLQELEGHGVAPETVHKYTREIMSSKNMYEVGLWSFSKLQALEGQSVIRV